MSAGNNTTTYCWLYFLGDLGKNSILWHRWTHLPLKLSVVHSMTAKSCKNGNCASTIQKWKASNAIAKRRLLECCGSERIYVLPFESSSFTILWLSMCCVLSGPFATAESPSYIRILARLYRTMVL